MIRVKSVWTVQAVVLSFLVVATPPGIYALIRITPLDGVLTGTSQFWVSVLVGLITLLCATFFMVLTRKDRAFRVKISYRRAFGEVLLLSGIAFIGFAMMIADFFETVDVAPSVFAGFIPLFIILIELGKAIFNVDLFENGD